MQTALIYIHGFNSSPASFKARVLQAALAERVSGATFLAPALPPSPAAATRLLDALVLAHPQAILVGSSLGGYYAGWLAERHAMRAVLVNPAVHSERWDRHLLPFIRHLVKAFPGIANDINKPGQDEGGYTKLPLHSAHSLQAGWAEIKADIAKVSAPLLLLHSRVDHVVEPSNAEWILANVSSADRTEVWLEDSFHVATLDHDAPLIFDASVNFLHRVAPQSSQG